jgi:hypothetical protein
MAMAGKENQRRRIDVSTRRERAQESEVRKERGRNGGGGESDLGFGIGTLFITEAAVGARNSPLNRAKIFGPEEG